MAALHFDFDDKVALIEEVKKRPVLWKSEHEEYGDRFYTVAAWKNIAQKFKIPEKHLRAKWKNLRDTYRNILNNCNKSDLEEYDGKWKYFHFMAFVKDQYIKNANDSIEFIVESDSGDVNFDDKSQASYSTNIKNEQDAKLKRNVTDDEESSKSDCEDSVKGTNKTQSESDEAIIRHIDKREYDDHTYHGKPEEINVNSKDDLPSKRQKTSHRDVNYDVMFLKSLAPYLNQIDPLRKLVIRSRIQDLLLSEITKQSSLKSDS